MIELIVDTLAKLYDAVIRGLCIAMTFTVFWFIAFPVVKYVPPILKRLGAW